MMLPNGTTRIEVNGRVYVGKTLPGVQAARLYRRLWALITAADVKVIPLTMTGRKEIIMTKIAMMDGFDAIADEVLADAVVQEPGVPDRRLPADANEVFKGRPSEGCTAALLLLADQGFFVVPGTSITSEPVTTPAPPDGPAQDPAVV